MKPQSAKAKGRKLQQWVVGALLRAFPSLGKRDARSTSMGASGEDVQLSEAAFKAFPYSIECKNRQANKTLYDWYKQAVSEKKEGEPLLVVKRNGERPLAVVDAEYFIKLHVKG